MPKKHFGAKAGRKNLRFPPLTHVPPPYIETLDNLPTFQQRHAQSGGFIEGHFLYVPKMQHCNFLNIFCQKNDNNFGAECPLVALPAMYSDRLRVQGRGTDGRGGGLAQFWENGPLTDNHGKIQINLTPKNGKFWKTADMRCGLAEEDL